MSLKGLKAGAHTIRVKAFYRETLAARASRRGQKRALKITLTKKLTARVTVC
jgi:hypothetical protein